MSDNFNLNMDDGNYEEDGYDYEEDYEDYEEDCEDEEMSRNDSVITFSISDRGISATIIEPFPETINVPAEDPKHSRMVAFLTKALMDRREVTYGEFMEEFNSHDDVSGESRILADGLVYNVTTKEVYHHYDKRTDALGAYIAKLAAENHPQVKAFARFAERLANNPSEHAQDQVFNWFISLVEQGEKLSISNEGKLIAYKGVNLVDGVPYSIRQGPGIVDGVFYKFDSLPNRVGSTVEVQRSYVEADPNIACGPGLHAGTFSYAWNWGGGNVLRVEVDPAHIVSVPRCSGSQKIRCHKYVVAEIIYKPEDKGVIPSYDFTWDIDSMERWTDAGYSIRKARYYISQGQEIDDALALEANSDEVNSGEFEMWKEAGYSPMEAIDFIQRGVTIDEVLDAGSSPTEEEHSSDEDFLIIAASLESKTRTRLGQPFLAEEDEPEDEENADENPDQTTIDDFINDSGSGASSVPSDSSQKIHKKKNKKKNKKKGKKK